MFHSASSYMQCPPTSRPDHGHSDSECIRWLPCLCYAASIQQYTIWAFLHSLLSISKLKQAHPINVKARSHEKETNVCKKNYIEYHFFFLIASKSEIPALEFARHQKKAHTKPGHSVYSGGQLTSFFGPITLLNLDLTN